MNPEEMMNPLVRSVRGVSSAVSIAALSISIFTVAVSTPVSGQQDTLYLNMGTSSSASSQYTYWVAAGQAIEAGTDGRIVANPMETGASVDNIRRMKRGEIEIGLSTGEAVGQAYRGEGAFEDEEPWEDLRGLWFYAALPNMYIVRSDSGVDNLEALEGKRYNAGIPGSSTEAQTRAAFRTLGIEPDLEASATSDAVDSLRDGRIVGFTKAAASATAVDSSFMELNATVDVSVIGFSQDQIERVLDAHPWYSSITVPADTYPDQSEPVETLAAAAGGIATKDSLSEEDAYQIVKAIFEHKDIQADAYPAVEEVDFAELTIDLAVIPLHAGAVRYFREIGVDIPDQFIPPEAR